MKREALAMGALLLGFACTNAEDAARVLLDEASAARLEGGFAQAESVLEDLAAQFPGTDAAAEAQTLLDEVRLDSETAALDAMAEIRQAQEAFMARERRHAQSIEELVFGLMLAEAPDGEAIGYRIRSRASPAADAYIIMAEASSPGRRSFFQDFDGVIRWARGEAADEASPPLPE